MDRQRDWPRQTEWNEMKQSVSVGPTDFTINVSVKAFHHLSYVHPDHGSCPCALFG